MVESGALGVVGAGVMGSEIAFLGAAASDHATLVDTDPAARATGLERARAIAVRRAATTGPTDEEAPAMGPRFSRAERLSAHRDSGRLRVGGEVGPPTGAADRATIEPNGAEGS